MRKIEKEMLLAIAERRNWHSGNTSVRVDPFKAMIFLYGKHIATWEYAMFSPYAEKEIYANFPTPTTTSRLRALGIDACVRNGVAYVNGEKC